MISCKLENLGQKWGTFKDMRILLLIFYLIKNKVGENLFGFNKISAFSRKLGNLGHK